MRAYQGLLGPVGAQWAVAPEPPSYNLALELQLRQHVAEGKSLVGWKRSWRKEAKQHGVN